MATAALMGIQAGSSLLGGILGSKGANEAAKTINQGTLNANGTDYAMYNQVRQDQAPYANAGAGAVNYLSYLLGIGGGPNGQMSNTGPASNVRLNTPTASAMAGMDNKYGSISANGNGFSWTPGSGNKRGYSFLYNDGQNDIYQRTSGGKGTGINLDYAVVGKDGKVNFAGQPPIGNQYGSQGGGQNQITDAMKSDPNFGSLMKDFSASNFQTDPGYQFRLSEGQKSLERSAAARGNLYSGGTLKDLTQYNQNFASNEYSNAYNRFQQNRATKYNQLASLAGMGQVSANTVAGATQNTANNVSNNTMQGAVNEANARASGYSSLANGITGAANAAGNWYQYSQLPSGGYGTPGTRPQSQAPVGWGSWG